MNSSRTLTAEAIVLGSVDYGESDRVVTFLSRERGRISAFAAGARKSKRRFAGSLEPFTRLDLRLKEGRGDLLFLESCQVLDGHGGLRDDLGRLGHAGHATELCRELCRDREPQETLFELLSTYLASLCVDSARPEDLLAFELGALDCTGVAPRLSDCAVCGGEVAASGALCDPPHGGVICDGCARHAHPGAFRLEGELLGAARLLQAAGPFAGVRIERERSRAGVRNLVRRFTYQQLGRHPRSLEFLEQLGIEG